MADHLPTWRYDPNFRTLDLRFTVDGRAVHAWITPRPHYCDRGHWQFNVDGPFDLDACDAFPRYFMSLDTALAEAEAFLRWRLFKRADVPHFARLALFLGADGREFAP